MTQWIPHKRREKVNKKRTRKIMTEGTESDGATENVEDTTELPNESGSDAGSDIFMPGGITVKATEFPSEDDVLQQKFVENGEQEIHSDNFQTKKQSSVNELKENVMVILNDNMKNQDHVDQNDRVLEESENTNKESTEMCVSSVAENINDAVANNDNDEEDKNSDSVGSPSSCLEINMEDDSAYPCSDKEKNRNSAHTKNKEFEERNIFSSNIFDGDQKKKDTESSEQVVKEITNEKENESTTRSNVDEHDTMLEDFEIGLRQKSYDVDPFCPDTPLEFESVEGNIYLIDKKKSRSKEDRYMQCECPFEPDDPVFVGCDDNCLNRLLLIECSARNCPTGDFCTNRSFQRGCIFDLEIFKAGKKGWGLKTEDDISKGAFIMEYCGEVVNYNTFQDRTCEYHSEGISHYYFMTLKQNEIIDATKKGSKSRFINHSCDPNCETQKWTVNGFLRVGFFALRHIYAGDELSFDYQFQRYGEKPQDCFCGADNCRGVIGSEQLATTSTVLEDFMPSDSPSQTEKKKKKGKQFLGSELAEELNELFGQMWELTSTRHTLELLRLMVKVSTTAERIVLLKIIQVSKNVSAMKEFVRYKGLSLLWSWMVDAPESKLKYKIELLKTLKHVPVPNRNELDDSKVGSIVQKWSIPVTCLKKSVAASKKAQRTDSLDDNSNTPSGSDNEAKNDEGGNSSQEDESSKEDNDDEIIEEKMNKTSESMEEGEILEDTDCEKLKKKKNKEDKSSEKFERRRKKVADLATALTEEWKLLKEVFRIPKKSQTPDRRSKQDTECPSPRPSTDKRNASLTKLASSTQSSFPSPPATTRHVDTNKGPFMTSSQNNDDITEPSSTDDRTTDDATASPSFDSGSSKKREWRKSPDHHNHHHHYSNRDSYNQQQDNNNDDRRDSRRGNRDRKNGYDRDRRRWNKEHDDDGGEGGRNQNRWTPKNRHWNDWNNRGNRHYGNRDNQMNRNDDQRNAESTWNGGGHWNRPPPPMPPHQPPPPSAAMNICTNRFNGEHSLQQNQPVQTHSQGVFPRMMAQPPMNIIPQASMQNMVPPQPLQAMNSLNVVLPNNQNSPLISPMSNQQFNPPPTSAPQAPPSFPPVVGSTAGQFNTSSGNTPDVTTLNMVNQLLLLNAERLKQTQGSGSHSSTPDNRNSSPTSPHWSGSASSPTRSKTTSSLPPHWKTATDADGRVYYYHTVTRQTTWDVPIDMSSGKGELSPKRSTKSTRSSIDSLDSPNKPSPRASVDFPSHKNAGPRTPPSSSSSRQQTSVTVDLQKIRDTFKSKISSVVVNCLNSYQKVDCKQGRIKSVDDFKFLARKLTHGLIMKERQRIGNEELLNCNDSVKLKVKEYIRNYMKKFGAVYIRS